MRKNLEVHLLFMILVLFTTLHLYYVLPLYLSGYKRFIEIWYAVYSLIKFTVIQ